MLIYVIPFILLLVIAIFLKKREASKEAEPSNKKTAAPAKTSAKKTTTTKKVAQKSVVVEEVVPTPQHSTPVPVKIQTNIENLIKERNFFAAEAQINQALKRDNSLHGLYLLLLDIHLQQKDEFAIDQLLNHLRSLELDDILSQAEAKKASHAHEDIAEKSANEALTAAPSSLDFTAPVSTPNQTASFDQLQHELTSNKTAEPEAALEFDTSSLNFSPAATPVVEKAAEPEVKAEPAALDFNFSLDSTAAEAKTEAPAITAELSVSPAEEVKPLDFTFDLTPSPAETTAPESTVNEASSVKAPSLDFNFSTPESASAVEAKAEPATPDFNFTFDSAPAEETNLQPAIEPEVIAAPSIALEPAATVVSTDVDLNDPLVKSFPDLSQVDEIQLNLDLANQYVELGAYDAAKALLSEQGANYSAEQRQRADQLLNQIAS
ncbi:fimbrial protein FimV [Acinetobacter towneri]|uniref:fimbrial protein FimV n=1 Tax=Acinetobacter towneri TaxID=202956 RepID=UPI0020982913|nr:fimbrial protein FimV [Acinetobacter towneri]MCO8059969.1 fimbrial protein FimV [Acinetobacter towneri]MCO8065657.1 fimbrial protein FimV [Acinetobacter towneri]